MCSFVVPDAKQFGIKKIQVDEHIGMTCFGLMRRVLRTLLNRLLTDTCNCIHWRKPDRSCFEAAGC